jgi:hypothetical protein
MSRKPILHPVCIFFDLSEMVDNNLNLAICRFKVNCQIREIKITKLKQPLMPTYCHIDNTDVIENHYTGVSKMAPNLLRVLKNRSLGR